MGQYICFLTPVAGRMLCLEEDGAGICGAYFYRKGEEPPVGITGNKEGAEGAGTPLLAEAKRQLMEYFDGVRREFDLPLSLHGTPFQLTDWKELCRIPYGETRTYGQLAAAMGKPKACRAVGLANHNNPVSIIVPCHRVIGSDRKLVGYGGGLDVKEALLGLEGLKIENGRLV